MATLLQNKLYLVSQCALVVGLTCKDLLSVEQTSVATQVKTDVVCIECTISECWKHWDLHSDETWNILEPNWQHWGCFFFTGYKERFWFLVWAVKTEWSSIKQQKQPTFFRQSHFTSHYHILDLHRVQICHPHMQCTKVQAKSAAKVKYELEMVSFILV